MSAFVIVDTRRACRRVCQMVSSFVQNQRTQLVCIIWLSAPLGRAFYQFSGSDTCVGSSAFPFSHDGIASPVFYRRLLKCSVCSGCTHSCWNQWEENGKTEKSQRGQDIKPHPECEWDRCAESKLCMTRPPSHDASGNLSLTFGTNPCCLK